MANSTRTYWYSSPRGFANEYSVGIATTPAHSEQYEVEGWERITRDRALRELSDRGSNATQIYAAVEVDGASDYNRFDVARSIRTGGPLRRGFW